MCSDTFFYLIDISSNFAYSADQYYLAGAGVGVGGCAGEA
jgi:hypothetical protein